MGSPVSFNLENCTNSYYTQINCNIFFSIFLRYKGGGGGGGGGEEITHDFVMPCEQKSHA